MSKAIWKGTISFGLVAIPVRLVSAQRRSRPAFVMLDRRDHAHIGYRRVNERTGEEVPREEVVSGYEYERGRYVEVAEEDIRAVSPGTYHRVRIEDFVPRTEIPPSYFTKPYYLEPEPEGRRAYVLLRGAVEQTDAAGICRVVIHNREHLAALTSSFGVLTLVAMRYHEELQLAEEMEVPRGTAATEQITRREQADARRLVEAMTTGWNPIRYPDHYGQRLGSWIERRVREEKRELHPAEADEAEVRATNVLDISELLERSIERRRGERRPPELWRRTGH
jgi:DNA end-binding protein Ku